MMLHAPTDCFSQVTISGHGNPSTLVLGDDRMLSSELRSSGYSDSKALLKELKPALIHTGGRGWVGRVEQLSDSREMVSSRFSLPSNHPIH